MAVFKASYSKGSGSSSVKYALHRKQEVEKDYAPRRAFTAQEEGLDTRSGLKELGQHEQEGKGYTYRFILNAGEGRDAPVDYQQWTRDTMRELELRLEKPVPYVAVVHDDHTEHTHVHVVAHLDKTLRKEDLNYMRKATTELYEQQKQQYHELVNDAPKLPFEVQQQERQKPQEKVMLDDSNEGKSKSNAGGMEAEGDEQKKPKKERQRSHGYDDGWGY